MTTTEPGQRPLSSRLVLLMAVACGAAVANLYYAQPLLSTIAHDFSVSDGTAGLLVTASQVGYGPSMVKQFSSPRPFASFQVVSVSGEVAFQGGPPVGEVTTDALGAVRTVWVGDFTPLQVPGRYRVITDDGISSHPFDVGAGVFDSAVRAVQRAFYYQRAFTAIDAGHAQGSWVHASDAALV